jgi:hypothetical protein
VDRLLEALAERDGRTRRIPVRKGVEVEVSPLRVTVRGDVPR